jgi:hypothetical protein
MNIFKRYIGINNHFRTSTKHQFPENPSKDFELNEKTPSLKHDFFNFDKPAFKQNKSVVVDPFIKKNVIEPKQAPIQKATRVPFQNFKVDNMKPIPIENPFKMITNGKDIQPLQHVNPQYYQYKLYKKSLADIAFDHMDAEQGEETELSKARGEFMNAYEKENPEDAKNIKTGVNANILQMLPSFIEKGRDDQIKELDRLTKDNLNLTSDAIYAYNKFFEAIGHKQYGARVKPEVIKKVIQNMTDEDFEKAQRTIASKKITNAINKKIAMKNMKKAADQYKDTYNKKKTFKENLGGSINEQILKLNQVPKHERLLTKDDGDKTRSLNEDDFLVDSDVSDDDSNDDEKEDWDKKEEPRHEEEGQQSSKKSKKKISNEDETPSDKPKKEKQYLHIPIHHQAYEHRFWTPAHTKLYEQSPYKVTTNEDDTKAFFLGYIANFHNKMINNFVKDETLAPKSLYDIAVREFNHKFQRDKFTWKRIAMELIKKPKEFQSPKAVNPQTPISRKKRAPTGETPNTPNTPISPELTKLGKSTHYDDDTVFVV